MNFKKNKTRNTVLAVTCLALTGLFSVANVVCNNYKLVISQVLNVSTYHIEKDPNADPNEDTMYFKSNYASEKELIAHEEELCKQVMEEGAALLKNDNNILPLKSGAKVSMFSQSSVRPVYGGTGSGQVNVSSAPTFKDALAKEGVTVNPTLWKFYETGDGAKYSRKVPSTTESQKADFEIGEVPWSRYGNSVKNSFATYGDCAIITLSRSGGEGTDLAINEGKGCMDGDYLRLNQEELDMLAAVKQYKAEGVFKGIVVLLNTSNMIQLDFLDEYDIDGALWIGDVGVTGINGVASILAGKVAPSGRTVETFLKDNHSSASFQNFGAHLWNNLDDYKSVLGDDPRGKKDYNNAYTVYQEGIYVGYRYFETRYTDFVNGEGNPGDFNYSAQVAYPFGSGLSYTTFNYSDMQVSEDADSFTFKVTVNNTGDVAAKHTVQIYMQAPYTQYDKDNGVEKSAVKLVGFEKTKTLNKGGSETVSVTVNKSEMAAYDSNKAKTYILDAGEYLFTVAEDAHKAANNFLAKAGKTPENTGNKMDAAGDAKNVYSHNVSNFNTEKYSVSAYTGAEITNRFDNADLTKYEGSEDSLKNSFKYLTRSDWKGTWSNTPVAVNVTETMMKDGLLLDGASRNGDTYRNLVEKYKAEWVEKNGKVESMPTTEASNGLTVAMLRTTPYDSEAWNDLIDQMSVDELVEYVSQGFHATVAVGSIGMPATKDENGPQGLTASLIGGSSAMAYTSEDILAATYNREIALDVGTCMGEDCLYGGYSGMYAPGANIHRTAYCGRNFEYYSEDGFVSGEMGNQVCQGISASGVLVQAKHFALNDQEDYRNGIATFANEQSIREIYLKSFEGMIANKGKLISVMSSFNRIGIKWAGAHRGLMNDVMLTEWNVGGTNITDCSTTRDYMDGVLGILSGTTLWDGSGQQAVASLGMYKDDPVVVQAMKDAAKRLAQSYSASNAMNGLSSSDIIVADTPWFLTLTLALAIGFGVATAVFGAFAVLGRIGKKED